MQVPFSHLSEDLGFGRRHEIFFKVHVPRHHVQFDVRQVLTPFFNVRLLDVKDLYLVTSLLLESFEQLLLIL